MKIIGNNRPFGRPSGLSPVSVCHSLHSFIVEALSVEEKMRFLCYVFACRESRLLKTSRSAPPQAKESIQKKMPILKKKMPILNEKKN
jgi:hypothetical protein